MEDPRKPIGDQLIALVVLLVKLYSPSYICAYCGKPAALSHLQASIASISKSGRKRDEEMGERIS